MNLLGYYLTVPYYVQRMVEKIKKQNEKADDLMEQQDDMIANYKVIIKSITLNSTPHSNSLRQPR